MAYSDASPAEIEERVRAPKRATRKSTRAPRSTACPTQSEIWGEWRAKRNRRGTLLAAFAAAGAALANGLLDERADKREITPAEELLQAIDISRDIRRVIGRLDISGDTDAAAWVTIRPDQTAVNPTPALGRPAVIRPSAAIEGAVIEVFYRHCREVLQDLVPLLDAVIRGEGWSIARSFDRIRRAPKMEAGVWVATFRVSRPTSSPADFPNATRERTSPTFSARHRIAA